MTEKTAQQMLTLPGFVSEFFKNLGVNRSHTEAYEITEQMFEDHFGRRRYRNYNTFRSAFGRYNRSMQKSNNRH